MRFLIVSLTACLLGLSSPGVATASESCQHCGQSPQPGIGCGCSECGELPCSTFCSTECNACQVPACGVCGTNACWDCSDDPGIDVDSLTPAAQSKKLYEASLARITFVLPENAGVSLMDQKMSTPGPKRSFVVSVSDQSKDYKYEVKVDVVRNGKKYFKKLKIKDLRAGMILAVTVDAPPVEEGEPAQINLEAVPLAVGGKPADSAEDAPAAEVTAIFAQ